MDHSLIRFSLSENLSAQHTQLTHFTRTPAQTRHRDHSFQRPLIYTEFLRYNYKFNAFHKRLSAHVAVQTKRVYTKPFTVQALFLGTARLCQNQWIMCWIIKYFCWRISHQSSYYFFKKGGWGVGEMGVELP